MEYERSYVNDVCNDHTVILRIQGWNFIMLQSTK